MEKLEGIRISQEDYQRNQLELKRRSEEIYELQNASATINVAIYSERKQVILINSELEYYKRNYFRFN